ncbi:hypothetical protein GCM10011578_053880 [Streptomyces fuscichromogenes]|uniref:DUF3626 domain-containing protein n=1 Tax=Streptomyces fuscichromogenes TaxID=1324013 RepID=A0A917XG03_9ACTN|nr:hypothetical protein GCM10011578_053880 [Streptomyces fuscichromogenes]
MHTARMGDDGSWSPQEKALRHVAAPSVGRPLDSRMRLTMNFHPDRLVAERPILRRLAEDGVYRSQFVTGNCNGGLTAYPGGDRWRWESRIFDGACDCAAADERPVYGALTLSLEARPGSRGTPGRYRRTVLDLSGRVRAERPPFATAAVPPSGGHLAPEGPGGGPRREPRTSTPSGPGQGG